MTDQEILAVAQGLLDSYRDVLLIDPFFKIRIEVCKLEQVSLCSKEATPLSWTIQLDPDRHGYVSDIQYSILDALIKIIFCNVSQSIILDEVLCRLTTAIFGMLRIDSESEEELKNVA